MNIDENFIEEDMTSDELDPEIIELLNEIMEMDLDDELLEMLLEDCDCQKDKDKETKKEGE